MAKQEFQEPNQLNFYYNREERLKKADPLAKYAISLHGRKRPGFFSSMTATPALRFLFFSILILALFIFGYQWYQNFERPVTVNKNSFLIKTMVFENTLYLIITRKTDSKMQADETIIHIHINNQDIYEKMLSFESEKGIQIKGIQKTDSATITFTVQNQSKTITRKLE